MVGRASGSDCLFAFGIADSGAIAGFTSEDSIFKRLGRACTDQQSAV